jgi:hypothetical protein
MLIGKVLEAQPKVLNKRVVGDAARMVSGIEIAQIGTQTIEEEAHFSKPTIGLRCEEAVSWNPLLESWADHGKAFRQPMPEYS